MTTPGWTRPPGRYPRAAFDTCYWLLADLCEQSVDLPLAQAWPIQEAFTQLASIGTPRHLELLDPATANPANPAPGQGTGLPAHPDAAASSEALAADLLRRVASLRGQAGSWQEAETWEEIRDLLTAAFPNPPGLPGGRAAGPAPATTRATPTAAQVRPPDPPGRVRAVTGELPPLPPRPVRPVRPAPSPRPPSAGHRGL